MCSLVYFCQTISISLSASQSYKLNTNYCHRVYMHFEQNSYMTLTFMRYLCQVISNSIHLKHFMSQICVQQNLTLTFKNRRRGLRITYDYVVEYILSKSFKNPFMHYKVQSLTQTSQAIVLRLALLNKLRCYSHFQFLANEITLSRLLIQIHILNENSADPDQKATGVDLHCLQRQGISWFGKTGVKV